MQVHLRHAEPEDYTSLCSLFDQIDVLHRDQLPHIFQPADGPARERGYYLGLLADGDNALFVAEMDGDLCGVIHAVFRQAPEIPILVPRRYVAIDSIVVKAEFQEHGIGHKLMDKAQEWALQRGAASIELNVYEFNQSAITFYRGLGFETLYRKMSKTLLKPEGLE